MKKALPAWTRIRWVSSDIVRAAVAILEHHGHSALPALRAAELPADAAHSGKRCSLWAASQLWRYTTRVCRDPAVGIRSAELLLAHPTDVVGYLICSSENLEQALRVVVEFAKLHDELLICELEYTGRLVTLTFRGSAQLYMPPVAEFALARSLLALRAAAGAPICPQRVRFAHERPPSAAMLRKFFGAQLEFGANSLQLVFARADLTRRVARADAGLHLLLRDYAERLLGEGAPPPRSQAERVLELVAQQWQPGQGPLPTREQIARKLRVTPRTLGRWLAEEGKTYLDILDELRCTAATRCIQNPDHPLGRLAERLGFDSQSAFTRAFRRWTGLTPTQYRRLMAADSARSG